MISVRLAYGLGNMMFQVAAIEYIGKQFNFKTNYHNIHEQLSLLKLDTQFESACYCNEYLNIFKNFNWLKNNDEPQPTIIRRLPFGFNNIFLVQDNTYFIGYFQSEKFWNKDRQFVRELFEPSDFIVMELKKYDYLFNDVTCCIHVRRGDFLKYPTKHPVVTMEYINKAKRLLAGRGIRKFLIFSDDMAWCRSRFIGGEYVFIEGEKDYVEIFLMGRCDHKIIANSTFSWWGAYLSPKEGIVTAPKIWITKARVDASHICPDKWCRL